LPKKFTQNLPDFPDRKMFPETPEGNSAILLQACHRTLTELSRAR
jgi:hypothetical protein